MTAMDLNQLVSQRLIDAWIRPVGKVPEYFMNCSVARSEVVDKPIDSLACMSVLFRSCSVKSALMTPVFGGKMMNA